MAPCERSAVWPRRLRSSLLAVRQGLSMGMGMVLGAVLSVAAAGLGCGTNSPTRNEGGADGADSRIVSMVAARDQLDEQAAAHKVADVLRLAKLAQQERANTAQGEPEPLLSPQRSAHIERAALARLWLRAVFEPAHRPEDIELDDPAYLRFAGSSRYVHPQLYMTCQLIAVPTDLKGTALLEKAKDPQWQAVAQPLFEATAQRLRRYVDAKDPDACTLMQRMLRFATKEQDGVTLRVESSAFDLDACAEKRPDGTCAVPTFVPEWVARVRVAEPPQFLPTFLSRFGFHQVLVTKILPAHLPEDPATQTWLRQQVHPGWRFTAFATTLKRLREQHNVRMTQGSARLREQRGRQR